MPSVVCPEERSQQSRFSPDVIQDAETLGRVAHHQDHIQDGELHPALFPIKDLTAPDRRGISVVRLDGTIYAECHETVRNAFGKPADWRWRGLATARCESVRGVQDGNTGRAFCAVDDGKPEFRSHALIRLHEAGTPDRPIRRLRARLLACFEFWPNATYFGKP